MTILRDISIVLVSVHSLILFIILFESRYPEKKTLSLITAAMLPLLAVNLGLFAVLGAERMGTLVLLSCSLPSMIFLWFLAKHRGGRFFFTFCLSDTLILEIMYLTNILTRWVPGDDDLFLFLSRLIAYPLLEWLAYKKIRPLFLEIQDSVKTGWGAFAGIGALFYVILSIAGSTPTLIAERPADIPLFLLIALLMPLLYLHIYNTLRSQQKMHEMAERENILSLHVANLTERMEEINAAEEKFRMERHDFRHKLETVASLVEKEEFETLHALVREYSDSVKDSKVKRYCPHIVLDAVFASYLRKAEERSLRVYTMLSFPETLPCKEAELAVVFANAIENAIRACEKLETEKRFLEIKVLSVPCFMIQITNSFGGEITFDRDELPVASREGHGFGIRSIAAFCEKYGLFREFRAADGVFTLRIMFGKEN
ncbi:MAG: GHKL domain-containing protein [Ruminococcaceae bacterium]|nr:GHKL domain-containing protein [Oscillospiraceae bacterium]